MESLIDPCSVTVNTDFTVIPSTADTLTNLSLLSPYIEFSNWVYKLSKNKTENKTITKKSTSMQITPLCKTVNTNNTNNCENTDLKNTDLASEYNFIMSNNFQQKNKKEINNENEEKREFEKEKSILFTRFSMKDFAFLLSTIKQLKENQKYENEFEIIPVQVMKEYIILYYVITCDTIEYDNVVYILEVKTIQHF